MIVLLTWLWMGSAFGGESKDQKAVLRAFAELVVRSGFFDPTIGELYADDAKITTRRDGKDLVMTGTQLKAVLPQAMATARQQGDVDTYGVPSFAPAEPAGRWRVTAVRKNARKCSTDTEYSVDYAKVGKDWLIVAEHSTTSAKSACPPDPNLGLRLAEMREQLAGQLPLTLDEETVLEAIEVEGTAITYGMRLANVVAGELTPLEPALRGGMMASVCGEPQARALLDAGATVRYRWTNAADESLVAEAVNGDCP